LLLVLSFSLLSCCCFTLLGQKLWKTMLDRLQSVSLKPPSSFLVLPLHKLSHTSSMSLV
jgi:hypothetical protein